MSVKVVIKNALMSYANLLEPRLTPDGSEEKYSVSIILDPKENAEDIKSIEAAIKEVLVEKFGAKAYTAKGPAKSYHNPLRDGEDRDDPVYEGKLFINASSTRKPQVVDRKMMPILDDEEVYSGCFGNISIQIFPFDVPAKKGAGCGLNNVQVVKKGDRLGGPASANEDFEEMDDDEELD